MKKWVADKLICPQCFEMQTGLALTIYKEQFDDVLEGELGCNTCGSLYPIQNGIAVVLPQKARPLMDDNRGYNSAAMLSAYLWSQFSDLLNDPLATDAYKTWASFLKKADGDALDIGCAVGRLSFELSKSHGRIIGIDNSLAFIRKAREILTRKRLDFEMIIEGHIVEPQTCSFDGHWDFSRVDFIVADALALPFRQHDFATVVAVNILEKVPDPLKHLTEINRVLCKHDAMFLFSDPFSWDEAFSSPEVWLSGNGNKCYSPRGIDTIRRMFSGEYGIFNPSLNVLDSGNVSWKIRKTENLWEHITSQYLVGHRS